MLRCLFIAPINTTSPLTGGGQRTLNVYRALSRMCAVDVAFVSESACIAEESEFAQIRKRFSAAENISFYRSTARFMLGPPQSAGRLATLSHSASRVVRALRPRSHFFRPSGTAKAEIDRLITTYRYDVIFGRYLQATALSGALDQKKVPVVVDLDDLDDAVLLSRMNSPTTDRLRRWVLRFQALQAAAVSKRYRNRCRHVFAANEADRVAIEHASSTVLPNVPYLHFDIAPVATPSSGRTVLFVGSFGHRPNREGVLHFLAKVWPEVRRRVGDARFRIAGSGGWESIRGTWETAAGVEIVGQVEELAGEYAHAAFCVSPVFEGSGTKIKILESLLYGRAIVAAAWSTRGFDDLLTGGLVQTTSDADMIEQIVTLLSDAERRATLVKDGQRLIQERYSLEAVFEVIAEALRRLASAVPPYVPVGTS